jgi:hypothetical protein
MNRTPRIVSVCLLYLPFYGEAVPVGGACRRARPVIAVDVVCVWAENPAAKLGTVRASSGPLCAQQGKGQKRDPQTEFSHLFLLVAIWPAGASCTISHVAHGCIFWLTGLGDQRRIFHVPWNE